MKSKKSLNTLSILCLLVAFSVGGYARGLDHANDRVIEKMRRVLAEYREAEQQRLQAPDVSQGKMAQLALDTVGIETKFAVSLMQDSTSAMNWYWFGFCPFLAASICIQGYLSRGKRSPVYGGSARTLAPR